MPSATAKGERAYLIKSVSGHLEPGKMAALMGPSGSGKTTLLDVLAGRKTTGTIEGDLRFAGHVGSREFLRRYTGYVEQFGACAGWGRYSQPARGCMLHRRPLMRALSSAYCPPSTQTRCCHLSPCMRCLCTRRS